jgi:hypothetical protein
MKIPIRYICGYFDEYKNQSVCEAGKYIVNVSNSGQLQSVMFVSTSLVLNKTFWWGGL